MHIALEELAHASAAIAQIQAIERTLQEYGVQPAVQGINFTGQIADHKGQLSIRHRAVRDPYQLSWHFTFGPDRLATEEAYAVYAWIQFYVKKEDGYTTIDVCYRASKDTWSITKRNEGSFEPNSAMLYGHVTEGPCTSVEIHALLKEAAALLVPAAA